MTPDKVNQADRALAAFIAGENGFAWTGQMYLDGQLDDDKIIEAIRHHRLSHSPADEGLREALERIRQIEPEELWDIPDRYSGERPSFQTLDATEVFAIIDAALSSDGAA